MTNTNSPGDMPATAIAVVGMAGRFPGADSVSQFWRNLRDGREAVTSLSEDELLAAGVGEKALRNHAYIRRAAVLDGIDEFDAEFFGFTPHTARMLDPQHRLFLQCAWHALEDAGFDPAGPAEAEVSVGVFGTSSASGYLLHNLMSHLDPDAVIGQGATFEMINLSLQNDKDHLATRAAHQFNFRGPALSVQTACSSSLVAVHLACQSIANGECDMALAGGASVRVPHNVGYWYEPGTMVSATGHCRPFDVRADGTIFGSGVGVVVLKPLQDALDAGDRIHAVIRGSAINNDGSTKMNYAAPNAAGQAEAIAEAHAVAEVDAATIGYVETHGTGTPLGDPIEIEGLRQAFDLSEQTRTGPCVLGSVKSNIGHLEVASGIVSLIKTILCLQNRALPATLHYTRPNPELHLDRGPFEIRGEYSAWESAGPRRAGVSSFGVGGTNVHVVLQEAPVPAVSGSPSGPQVLMVSARTPEALAQSRAALAAELSAAADLNLADVAHTLAGRRTEDVRLAVVADEAQNAARLLAADEHDNVFVGTGSGQDNSAGVVFLFPGQGAQHVGMARGLYETEPVFAGHFDRSAAAFGEELGIDLRAEMFEGSSRNLERTDRAQPALFTVQYALAELVRSYGIRPAALAGHSIGEYAAATIAGVFDLPTAVKAVAMRARLMHSAPRGVMVAVALSPDEIGRYLTPDVDLAAVNDPGSCVVAGSEAAIAAFQDRLAESGQPGIVARRVRTSHAFHSRLMDGALPEFTAYLSRLALRQPQIPLLSNVSGAVLSAREATDPATWARQIRSTVRFSDELDLLLSGPNRVYLEVGPGGTLTSSAVRHPKWSAQHHAVRLMRHHMQNRSDQDTFRLALGQLWAADVEVDWAPTTAGGPPRRVTLPGYPFVRQRHWVEHQKCGVEHQKSGVEHQKSGVEHQKSASGDVPTRDLAGGVERSGGAAPMESTLQRIFGQCLGVATIDPGANFFQLGGDSLIAIGVAMTATREGLDLTPQDIYDNPTVSALAKTLAARYAAGGLTRQPAADAVVPPPPPNVEHFLERGLREAGRWRVPVILRLRTDVTPDDVSAVLAAVHNNHDALRLRLVERSGSWEQQFADPVDTVPVAVEALPDGSAERPALLSILERQIAGLDLTAPPLVATFVTGAGAEGGSNHLVLSLHGTVGDATSRDVLVTDLFTAFGQRAAGQPIVLQQATTSWREWSQRCAGLATHPAVLDSRQYWLDTAAKATVRLVGPAAETGPSAGDLTRLPAGLTVAETTEIDDARRRLKLPLDDFLLAALGRAVGATVGDGNIAVDIGGPGRSVLKPEVDLGRTVGWFTTLYPLALHCSAVSGSARQQLDQVRDVLRSVPHHGIGYGLLRYVYAPTARLLAAMPPADILLDNAGTVPELPAMLTGDTALQFDADTALPVREMLPGLGHAVALRVYRAGGVLHLDWWYDTRRVTPDLAESLAGEYAAALLELARESIVQADIDDHADQMGSADDELELVDLSELDADIELGGSNAHR